MTKQKISDDKKKPLSEALYCQLIHVLEYETSPFYRPDDQMKKGVMITVIMFK